MSSMPYASLEDVIKQQQQKISLLEKTEKIVLGYSPEVREMILTADSKLKDLKNDTDSLKAELQQVKKYNDEITVMAQNLRFMENLISSVEDHFPDSDFKNVQELALWNGSAKSDLNDNIYIQPISEVELQSLPMYLGRRIKLEHVNEIVSMLNKTLSKKYKIMKAPNKCKYEDKKHIFKFKDQERSCPGLIFCTEEDIKNFCVVRPKIAIGMVLPILRTLQRVKEIRSGGYLRIAVHENIK